MAGEVLALFAYHFAQPFSDFRVVYIVVVYPALVAGVVGRINVDALHPALIPGQQGLQRVQIIPVDDHIFTTVILGVLAVFVKTILPVKHPERYLLMVVDDLLFSNPLQCRHGRSSLLLLSQKTFPVSGGPHFVSSNPPLRRGSLNFESGPLSGNQRFQHIHDLAVLNVGGVGKLLAVLLPHGFEFPTVLDVVQNGGHIRNLTDGAAMGCSGV